MKDFGFLLGTHFDTFSARLAHLFFVEERLFPLFGVLFGASKKIAKKLPKHVPKGAFFEVVDMAQV